MKARDLAEFLMKHPDADMDVSVDMSDDKSIKQGPMDDPRVFAEVFGVQQSRGQVNILARFTSKNYAVSKKTTAAKETFERAAALIMKKDAEDRAKGIGGFEDGGGRADIYAEFLRSVSK